MDKALIFIEKQVYKIGSHFGGEIPKGFEVFLQRTAKPRKNWRRILTHWIWWSSAVSSLKVADANEDEGVPVKKFSPRLWARREAQGPFYGQKFQHKLLIIIIFNRWRQVPLLPQTGTFQGEHC